MPPLLHLRRTLRVLALALLLVAGFVALTGGAKFGGALALAGLGLLAAARARLVQPSPRPAAPAAA